VEIVGAQETVPEDEVKYGFVVRGELERRRGAESPEARV
jgi:hypothetical protein